MQDFAARLGEGGWSGKKLFPCEGRGPDPGWRFIASAAMLIAMKRGYVYIMASGRNGTIYIGVTSDLIQRVWQHRNGLVPGFTRKHGCKLLVWYGAYDDLQEARLRELQMKKWKRQWKLGTIEQMNPDWRDLFPTLLEGS